MKYIKLLALVFLWPCVLLAQERSNAEIKFLKTFHDFGDIKKGDTVICYFEFANSGTDTLKITKVVSSDVAVAPIWENKGIPPGGKGKVGLKFDSTNKVGMQIKGIFIVEHNAKKAEFYSLSFKANVME